MSLRKLPKGMGLPVNLCGLGTSPRQGYGYGQA